MQPIFQTGATAAEARDIICFCHRPRQQRGWLSGRYFVKSFPPFQIPGNSAVKSLQFVGRKLGASVYIGENIVSGVWRSIGGDADAGISGSTAHAINAGTGNWPFTNHTFPALVIALKVAAELSLGNRVFAPLSIAA